MLGNLLGYRLNVIQLFHHVIVVPQLLVQVAVGIVGIALIELVAITAPPILPACHAFAQLPLLSHLSCLRHSHIGPTSLGAQGLTRTPKLRLGLLLAGFLAPGTCLEAEGGEGAVRGLGGPEGGPGVGLSRSALVGPAHHSLTSLGEPPTKPLLTPHL